MVIIAFSGHFVEYKPVILWCAMVIKIHKMSLFCRMK